MNSLVNPYRSTTDNSGTASAATRTSLRTAIIGVSGYAGGELARLLLHHPRFNESPPYFFSRAAEKQAENGVRLSDLHPNLSANKQPDHVVLPFDWQHMK